MNALAPAKMAQSAYGTQAVPVRTDRGTEYAAFSQITRRIKAAADHGPEAFPALAAALHENRRLWTIIASDVAHADNRLPQDLRARLFYLAEFTLQYTSKVLSGQEPVRPLIEINAAVMRGLSQDGGMR